MQADAMLHPSAVLPTDEDAIPVGRIAAGDTVRCWLRVTRDEVGEWHRAPVIVRRGRAAGPTVTFTAVIHGQELNGMRALHQLLAHPAVVDLQCGTIIAVPVVSIPGFRRKQRVFADGKDLNRNVKDEEGGRPAQRYARGLADKLLEHSEYLIDLHTAGPGRRNMFYARVDMDDATGRLMAEQVAPELIAHKPARAGSLRGYASDRGVPTIVLEVGDSARLQPAMIARASAGLLRFLAAKNMVADAGPAAEQPPVCRESDWLRASAGGTAVLAVEPGDRVAAGSVLATVVDVFGDVVDELRAAHAGIVVGSRRHPVVMEGTPLVHVGVLQS